MQAFHGKAAVKAKYLGRVRRHRKADQIIKGTYWESGKGCAIGCTIHSGNHAAYETELGIPILLARLEDGIFESLPNDEAMLWPERFLSSIKPGADLSGVWPRFAMWMLADPKWGVLQFANTDATKKAIQDSADACQGVVDGKSEAPDWKKLRSAAAADSAAAATAHWAAATRWAAAAAADSARWAAAAADSAHWAAATRWAAAAAAARWRSAQAEKLLELLAAAPVPKKKVA